MKAHHWLIGILAVSVILRLIAAFAMGNVVNALPGISDQQSYDALAQRVLSGYGFNFALDWWPATRAGEPTAHWSYLYTLYLAGVYAITGTHAVFPRVLQAVIVGLMWPWLAFRIGKYVANDRIGLIAAAWTAVYGYFVYYTAALMTEPFYITAILWMFDLALRMAGGETRTGNWLLLGLAIGIAVLLRQLFLLFAPFLLLWLMWRLAGKIPVSKIVARMAISLVILAVMIIPFTLRNARAFGRFVLLNTNSGYALFFGNHPIYGAQFQAILKGNVTYLDLIPANLRVLDEAALDGALMSEAIKIILADPIRYILLSISRIPVYFQFWPSAESGLLSNIVRVASFGVALPFMLAGLWMVRRNWRRWSLLYLFIAVYTLIHLLSWSLIRYRLPVDAILLIFAASSINALASIKKITCGLINTIRKLLLILKSQIMCKILKILVVAMSSFFIVGYVIPWSFAYGQTVAYSGVDMHSYWYLGQFFRQSVNGYAALAKDPTPDYWIPNIIDSGDPYKQDYGEFAPNIPITFIDGYVQTQQPAAQTLITTPVVTAPLAILVSQLSWLSWPIARLAWLIINVCLAIFCGVLLVYLLPADDTRSRFYKLLIWLTFASVFGLRQALVVGQVTLVVLALCLLSILFSQRLTWLAGLCLGIALSKYSLAFPVALFLFSQRRYKLLLISVLIQVGGLVALTPLKWGAIDETVSAYYEFFLTHGNQTGIHLASFFPEGSVYPLAVSAFLTGIIVLIYFKFRKPSLIIKKLSSDNSSNFSLQNLRFLALFSTLTLLVTYHRVHDTPIVIFGIMAFYEFLRSEVKRNFFYWMVLFAGAISLGLLILPSALSFLLGFAKISSGIRNIFMQPEPASALALLIQLAVLIAIILHKPINSQQLIAGD